MKPCDWHKLIPKKTQVSFSKIISDMSLGNPTSTFLSLIVCHKLNYRSLVSKRPSFPHTSAQLLLCLSYSHFEGVLIWGNQDWRSKVQLWKGVPLTLLTYLWQAVGPKSEPLTLVSPSRDAADETGKVNWLEEDLFLPKHELERKMDGSLPRVGWNLPLALFCLCNLPPFLESCCSSSSSCPEKEKLQNTKLSNWAKKGICHSNRTCWKTLLTILNKRRLLFVCCHHWGVSSHSQQSSLTFSAAVIKIKLKVPRLSQTDQDWRRHRQHLPLVELFSASSNWWLWWWFRGKRGRLESKRSGFENCRLLTNKRL